MSEINATIERESTGIMRAAKIVGGAILTGLAAYGLARGVEMLVPVDPSEIYEGAVVGAGLTLGGALTALATEK